MATTEFLYNGISYEDDIVHIPILSPMLKQLHLIFPTMFVPFILKHQIIFFIVTLGVTILCLILQAILTPYEAIPTYEKEVLEADFRDFFGSKTLKKRKSSNDETEHEYQKVDGKELEESKNT